LAIQQLAIPEHIAFSGMGSLYMKYLTEDTNVLSSIIKSIFEYVGLKVKDKEGNEKLLSIHFTDNPKKVTAEGGLLMFNATRQGLVDMYVKSQEVNLHLYSGEEDEDYDAEILKENVESYKEKTVAEVERFLNLYKFKPFSIAISELDGNYPQYNIDGLRKYLNEGFDLTLNHEHSATASDVQLKDVLFFWPIKHALFMLTNDMANLTISINHGGTSNA
jgi:hypothetical protein